MRQELPKDPPPAESGGDSRENPTLAAESFLEEGDVIALDPTGSTTRYQRVEAIGHGGMGEVHLCQDQRIRREVAMKVMRKDRAGSPEMRARFFREVLSQGKLEHPAVVPVYDVGTDERGSLYFTMRRVRGETLEKILAGSASKSPEVLRHYSRHKLLTAFGHVCLAVEYAHSRSVLHCDLKPANVMFGDFGEVYVLDWGLAMRKGSEGRAPRPSQPTAPTGDGSDTSAVSGTPGYMAPEQIRGEAVDARADVYALGSILYEMLTLAPLHVGKSPRQLCIATLAGLVLRPSARAPHRDVPPELEAICMKATQTDPRLRYASAREMYEDLEKYLEGDRDLALRRSMSREHAESAQAKAAEAEAADTAAEEGSSSALRRQAMQLVSRSLALDPDNKDALRTLLRLLTHPPRHVPPEVLAEIRAVERKIDPVRARSGAMATLAWFACVPAYVALGIRSVPALVVSSVAWLLAGIMMFARSRRPRPDGHAPLTLPLVVGFAVSTSSVLLGPLVLTPTVAAVFALGMTMSVRHEHRYVPMVAFCAAVVAPLALESLRVLPPSMVLSTGMLCIVPQMFDFNEHYAILLVPSLACVVMGSLFAVRIRKTLARAQERAYVSAWQLRQLLPAEAGPLSLRPPS